MKQKSIVWTMVLLAIPILLVAQNKTIVGRTIQKDSGEPIPFVNITTGANQVNSDKNGQFEIVINSDEKEISVERMGFYTLSIEPGQIRDGQVLVLEMEHRPIVFGEIIIEEKRKHSIPQSDEILNQVKMLSQAMDAGDLISGVNGFGVSKRGAYAQEPVFRSFKQEQINILFDGFIQYNHSCPNRMDPSVTHVIPGEIHKVEIIKGPFSVRYGSSLGATLNYLTESANEAITGLSGTIESGYDFNGEGKTGRASLSYKVNTIDLYLNASLKDYEDYKSGSDVVVPSSFNSRDYGIKLGFNPANNQRLMLTWKQSFLRDAKYAGLPMDARKDDSGLASLSYKITNLSPSILFFEIKAFGNQVDHVMDNFDRMNFSAVEAESFVSANTYGGKMEFSLAPVRKDILFAGLDYRLLFRDGYRERLVKKDLKTGVDLPAAKFFTDKIWQDSRLGDMGIFLENKYYPNNKITLTGGLRIDLIHSQIDDPAEDFASLYDLEAKQEMNFSANLSLAYFMNRGVSFQFALGRGVRGATIDERYINHFSVGKDPYELVGNPDLRPEVNHQIELAVRKQSNKIDVQLNVFYSFLNDLITAAVDSTIERKYSPWLEPKFAKRFVNVKKAYQTGAELSADYLLTKHINLHGQWAYTYSQNITWDEPISRVPPMEGGLRISYERERWWTSLDGRFVAKQNRVAVSFGESETPGFTLLDFRAGLKPVKNLVLGLTISNIFNVEYVEFLNWSFNSLIGEGLIQEPGRNLSLYGKYSF